MIWYNISTMRTLQYKPKRIIRKHNAENVAKEVLDKIQKGKKVSLRQIILNNGYSSSVADKPSKVTQTYSYQSTIAPYIQRLTELRDKTLIAINSKNLPEEKLYDLTVLLKSLTHDAQLLQGKSTENIANKTEVVVYGSEDFLAKQMNKNSTAQHGQGV